MIPVLKLCIYAQKTGVHCCAPLCVIALRFGKAYHIAVVACCHKIGFFLVRLQKPVEDKAA